jgi:hypothetical protein
MTTCKICLKEIEWRKTAKGEWHPFNPGSKVSHRLTCGQEKTKAEVKASVKGRRGLESGIRRNLGEA